MNKSEKIKQLIKENTHQKERIFLLENVIKDFHKKMNSLLNFCKIQDRQTEDEILQSKFNTNFQEDE